MSHVSHRAALGLLATAMVVLGSVASAHDGKLTFAPVLAEATPAVVSIDVDLRRVTNRWINRSQTPRTTGSGVVIDADLGHVVTNHHVIEGADEITVRLKDDREFKAELVGSDPATDIALLRIEAEDLTALPLGDSDELAVGDFVVAIGNPFNLGQTATSGIVSGLGRSGIGGAGYEDFIQTDASINRGNSGGPLVDLDGRLVGINSMIYSPSRQGTSAGLGFAIPANIVRSVTEQLQEHGDVRRAQLGILMRPVTPDVVPLLGLESARGVIVRSVVEGSSAEDAGIEPGDVIVGLDGEDVVDGRDLWNRIGLSAVGEKVKLDVIRDGDSKTLQATLGVAQDGVTPRAPSNERLAGAQLRDVSREHRLYGRIEGVEVVEVQQGSPAAERGLEPGDIIVAVNRKAVQSVREFEAATAGDEPFGMFVQRGLRQYYVVVERAER